MRAFQLGSLVVATSLSFIGCATGNDAGGSGGAPPTDDGEGGEAGNGGAGGGGGGGAGGMPPVECDVDPCKLVAPQCGCNAGDKCSIDNTGTALCTPEGDAALGEVCDAENPCIAGAICVVTKSTAPPVSTCMKFCEADIQCKAPGGLCVYELDNPSGTPIPGVLLCTQNCDPLTNTGCAATGTSCQVAQAAGGQQPFFTFCTGAGLGGQGATCTDAEDCQTGFGCFEVGADLQCAQWCDLANPTCPVDTTCQIPVPAYTIGEIAYGVCS